MVKYFRHFLIRVVIAFTGVLVIAPQVSYKFYLCANLPAPSLKTSHKTHVRSSLADVAGSLLKHERRHRLTIDKRYTVKLVFALLPARLSISEQSMCTVIPVMPKPVSGADPFLIDHRLRGPPCQLLQSSLA